MFRAFFFGHLVVLHRWAPNILGGTTTFQNSTWTGQRSFRRWAKDKADISLKLSVLNLSKFDESTIIDGSILKSKRTVFRITKDGVLYFLLRTSSFKQSNPFKAHVAPPTPSIHLAMSISGMSLQTLGQAEAPVALDSEDAKRCVAKELGLGDKSLVTSYRKKYRNNIWKKINSERWDWWLRRTCFLSLVGSIEDAFKDWSSKSIGSASIGQAQRQSFSFFHSFSIIFYVSTVYRRVLGHPQTSRSTKLECGPLVKTWLSRRGWFGCGCCSECQMQTKHHFEGHAPLHFFSCHMNWNCEPK